MMFVFFGSAGISTGGSLENSVLPNLPTMKEIRERLPAKSETVIKAQPGFCNKDTAIIDFEVLSPWRYISRGAIYADDNVWGHILGIRIKKIHCQNLAPENKLRPEIFTTLLTNHIFKKEYRTGDQDIRRLIRLTNDRNTNGNLYFEPNYNERIPKDLWSWLKLDRSFREDILDHFSPYPENTEYGITRNEFSTKDGNIAERFKQFARVVHVFMKNNSSLEVDDDYHSTIGEKKISMEILTLRSGHIIGGRISYFQLGCDMADEYSNRHFNSEVEAKNAGCDFSDVSWSAYGLFDHNAKPVRYDDYMEWSGY